MGVQTGIKDVQNQMHVSNTDFYNGAYISKSTINLNGPIAGGQIGCNVVFNNNFLLGLELEGVYGSKNQNDCQTMTDPVTRCIDLTKKKEAFLTARVGYVFNSSPFCTCDDKGFLVYARVGAGYTRTDVKMNVNATSYLYTPETNPIYGSNVYRPLWSHAYDLSGSKSFISPVLGVGVEHALDKNWTIRGDLTSMFSMTAKTNATVDKIGFATYGPGGALPMDFSGVGRHPNLGDKLPVTIKEVETKLTVGLNRLF